MEDDRKLKAWQGNLLTLAVTFLLVLIALEGGMRFRVYQAEKKMYELKAQVRENLNSGGYARQYHTGYGFLVTPSKNDSIVYELKPHLNWQYQGAIVNTNLYGFRDEHYPVEKPEGVKRIFGIGDSVMFGQGVAQGKDYLNVLEGLLNERTDIRWEAINSAVPEYNTVMEVETLRAKGLKFSPDIVIIGTVSNDFSIPLFVRHLGLPDKPEPLKRLLTPRVSFLLSFVKSRLGASGEMAPLLPNRYSHLLGRENALDALEELAMLSSEHGFEVLMLSYSDSKTSVDREFLNSGKALGFHVMDMEPAIKEELKATGADEYKGSALTVPDGHPSARAHELTAETIYEYLSSSGLL